MIAPRVCCDCCGHIMSDEDVRDPHPNWPGICNDCYLDNHTTECDRCGNYEDEDQFGEIGGCIVVVHSAGISPGVYEVLARPFYSQPIIGGGAYIYSEAVRRLNVPIGKVDDDGAPCHMLCRECSRAAKRLETKHQHSPRG